MTSRSRFLAGSLGTVAALGARPSLGAGLGKLQIGYVPSTLFAPVFVAAERGYFKESGFDPNLTPVVAGQDAMALAATGQLDLVAAALSAAFYNAVNRGLDVRFVASTAYQPKKGHPSALMIREDLYDAGARTLASLRGKKIGWIGGAGAVSAYYVARILRPAGLTLKDVDSVNIANPDQAVALQRKAIDAVFTSSPFTEAFAQQKLAQTIGFPPAGISGSGIFFGPNLIKNPDAARAAIGACRKAAAEISGNGYYAADALAAYAKYTRQPLEVIQKAPRYDVYPDLRIDQATVEDVQREFMSEGILAYKALINEVQLVARY
jgi:NitT/TauT family transport system substrate-binding protein